MPRRWRMPREYPPTRSPARPASPTRSSAPGMRPACLAAHDGGVDREVLAPGEARQEARLLDDRAHAAQRVAAAVGEAPAEQADVPRRRPGQAQHGPDQRRLARAVGPEQPEGDAAGHVEVDAAQRRALAEALAQVGGLDRQVTAAIGGRRGHAAKLRTPPPAHMGHRMQLRPALRVSSARRLIPSDETPCARSHADARAPLGHDEAVVEPGLCERLAQLRGALREVRPALEVHGDDRARAEGLRGLCRGVGA